MQESCFDYYNCSEYGCCLKCERAEEGCLCKNCKCTKCYWYSPDLACNRPCDMAREPGKRKYIQKMIEENKRKGDIFLKLQEINLKIEKGIISKGNRPNFYSCQKCQNLIVTEEEFKIVKNIFPLCLICRGCL